MPPSAIPFRRAGRIIGLACSLMMLGVPCASLGAQDQRTGTTAKAGAIPDAPARLDRGRQLLEAGDYAGVRELLLPLTDDPRPDVAGRAESLLGTAAYWSGDFTRAARHFQTAIRLTPGDQAARRQLDEIRTASAAWFTVTGEVRRDDQPLSGSGGGLEMGWYPTPLTTLGLRIRPMRMSSGTVDVLVASTELSAGAYVVPLRLEAEVRGGIVRHEPRSTERSDVTSPIGALSLGFRLPAGLALRGMVERAPYLWTEGSLATPLEQDGASARLEWAPRSGWLGEVGGGVVRFPDDNIVVSTHLWVLAPLVRRTPVELRGGYAFGLQDSRESRFVPAPATGAFAGPPGSRRSAGRYEPYYTPEMVIAHSAVAALSMRSRSGASLALDGSVGVHASELAPTPGGTGPGGGTSQLEFERRFFRPWRVRGVLAVPVTRVLRLELIGEHSSSAFYTADVLTMRLHYRRLPRSLASGD